MAEFVGDCPRCGAKSITFDALQAHHVRTEYDWQKWYEVFCVCRKCSRSSVFVLANDVRTDHREVNQVGILNVAGALNRYMSNEGYISLRDTAIHTPPDHLPDEIEEVFKEGATCQAVRCWNAAGAMFRLCIDLATQPLLPEENVDGLNSAVRRSLGLRLRWLFDSGVLPEGLSELSKSVREDGNDGAHAGTLTKEDADDLLDFTKLLLERLYTEPERLKLAEQRRNARRE